MPLDWSVEHIDRYKQKCFRKSQLRVETEMLIWATMSVGMNNITENNWIIFYSRMKALEETGVRFLIKHVKNEIKTIPIKASLIKKHIGLSTNASTITASAFEKMIIKKQREKNK